MVLPALAAGQFASKDKLFDGKAKDKENLFFFIPEGIADRLGMHIIDRNLLKFLKP